MFRVMALDLWRDRPALVMTFVLPSIVFLIFSAVFSGTTGLDVKLKVALADVAHTSGSARLVTALMADRNLRAELTQPQTTDAVRAAVRSGRDDSGLVVTADPSAPGTPLLVVTDRSRAVAAPLTEARTRDALERATPDVLLVRTIRDVSPAIGPLTRDQQDNADIAADEAARGGAGAHKPPPLFAQEDVARAKNGGAAIAYYAGAVTILFSLFASTHGALTLVDERRAGIADRILAGRYGMAPVVTGKFIFLIAQAAAQAALIFATAELVYGVDVLGHFGLWLATTIATSIASAGISLGIVALCRTREQAQMLSTFVILILAAIGGSMVPRFLMPPWLQDLGWWTPHAWVIDAYQGLLWRDAGAADLYKAWIVLTLIGVVGFLIAQAAARRVST